jgi:iron complex transport system substrate-binding protein
MKRLITFATLLVLMSGLLCGCSPNTDGSQTRLNIISSMQLQYAKEFSIDYYEGGYKLVIIGGVDKFLVVPEDKETPKNIDSGITVLKQPLDNLYLTATSAMCLFDALGALDSIKLSGTKADGWYIENAKKAMEQGRIKYAGKYSAPDYELIMSSGCKLAVESTMLDHTPEVKEKLLETGVPVLVERSSYEAHPLGRTEWLKLYGALLNKEGLADKLFDEQVEILDELTKPEPTARADGLPPTVAYFYITAGGTIKVHKPNDYVTEMLELAGGKSVFNDILPDDGALSTMTIESEKFYAAAKNADVIIYDSAVAGELKSINELVGKNKMFADFKAVKGENVWCTSKNMFQETTKFGEVMSDMHKVLTGNAPQKLEFMYRLEWRG